MANIGFMTKTYSGGIWTAGTNGTLVLDTTDNVDTITFPANINENGCAVNVQSFFVGFNADNNQSGQTVGALGWGLASTPIIEDNTITIEPFLQLYTKSSGTDIAPNNRNASLTLSIIVEYT